MNSTLLHHRQDEARALAKYRKGNFLILVALAAVLALSAKTLRAQTNAYWDVNGTTSGQGGTGTWGSTGVLWTTNSANATANSGGPTGGGLFAVTNANPGATATNSGNYIFNFGGTAGTVTQGGSYQAVGVNFLTSGYVWNIDGTGANARTITTTNGVSLGANALTVANGARGLNSFTFTGPTAAAAVGITGTNGATLTFRNLVADSSTNSFGVYLSGGTISSNISVNVDIGTGSKIFFGSQSSTGMTNFAAITLNTNASGVALNITNSSSGIVAMNGVISGANGLVLDNAGGGKIALNAANTYAGGTTLNNTGNGAIITMSNAAAFGTGTITSAGSVTNYIRSEVSGLDITNNWVINSGSILRLNANNSGWNITASGGISGAGSMFFSNSGVNYRLTGTNNSFGGGVTVGNGTLWFSTLGMAGANSSLGTNGVLQTGGSTQSAGFRWINSVSETSDKNISLNTTTGGLTITADSATADVSLTLNGAINSTAAGNKTITLRGNNNNSLVLGGLINEFSGSVNSLVVDSTNQGTVVLGNSANSFSGGVSISGAATSTNTVQVANIGNSGQNSSLGKNGTINIGGSSSTGINILKYTGSGETSDKVINLAGTSGGATLDQSGSGNLKFTTAMTATGVGAKSLTLQGSTAGTGEVASAISDLGGNMISLNKSGTGTWTLSGSNTYSGGTTVSGGTLATSGNERLSDTGTVAISNTATLRLGGHETVANVAGVTGSTLDLQSYTLTVGGGTSGFTNTALTIGSGSIVKNGTNLIYLNNSGNTYSGGFTLNGGEVAYTSSGTYGVGGITSTVFGTGTLTINGGIIRSSSDTSSRNIANNILLNGDVQFGAAGAAAAITVTNIAGGTTTLTRDITVTSFAAVDYKQAINGAAYRLTYAGTNYYNSATNLNVLSLQASNNIAGLTVNAGTVSYKNRNSFGNGDLILANGVVVGQDGTINNGGLTGNDRTDRAIANNIILNGNVTFGLGGTANYLGGNMDLGGATRTITLGNTTYQYGAVTNGGLVIDNGTAPNSRALSLFASNSYSGGTVVRTNAIFAVGHDQALGTGNLVFTNTTGSGVATLRASTLSTAAAQLRTITNNIQLASGMNVTVDTVSSAQDASGNSVSVNLDTTLAGTISGGGGLIKTNSNRLTLSGNNTFSGATTVSAGTLEVASGASIGSSATTVNGGTLTVNGTAGDVTVNSGGTLKGSGTLSALSIASGGTLAVGSSPGTLTASSVIWNGGGLYSWELQSAEGNTTSSLAGQGTNWDFLNVSGVLDITASSGNEFIIDIVSLLALNDTTFDPNNNYSFAIATAAGGISNFDASDFSITGFLANTGNWSLGLATTSGTSQSLVLAYNGATAIPEPSTGALLLVGLLGAISGRRRRHTS